MQLALPVMALCVSVVPSVTEKVRADLRRNAEHQLNALGCPKEHVRHILFSLFCSY